MKHMYNSIAFLLFASTVTCFSQVAAPYEVGTWQGFRSAAISYTFDDNCPNQFAIAVPMFNEFGFKLTLFAVTASSGWAWPPDWSKIQAAAAQGHEVASHTVTHPHISGLAYSSQVNEFKNSKDTIESRIPGQKCVTTAYPYCETGYDTLINKLYIAARICSGSIEPKTPSNFMRISSIICGTEGAVKTSANFKTRADNAATTKGWVVYLIHGINGDGGWSDLHADTLRASLEYLKANPDKFWVETFGNVAKYIRERNAASVSEISVSPDTITIAVTDTMDNSIFDIPVTIRRPMPAGWATAIVLQNGDTLTSQVVESNSTKYLMFDVIPDNGEVILVKTGATSVGELEETLHPASLMLYQNYPNPFNPVTTISYYVPERQQVEIKVFNLLGNEVATLVHGLTEAGLHTVTFGGSNLSSGLYFCRMTDGKGAVQTKKLVLLK